jgi:uridine kinase
LLDIVRRLGLDTPDLRRRPLAANIAGETFTLNYVPLREANLKTNQPVMLRRAMRAANGVVTLLRYDSARGNRVYERTMLFDFLLAMRKLYPCTRVRINYAVGAGLFATVGEGVKLSQEDIDRIKCTMRDIVKAALTLERKRLEIDDQSTFSPPTGRKDKVRLLNYRRFAYFDVYRQEDYVDYFYGEMAPSTGICQRIRPAGAKRRASAAAALCRDPNKPAKHVSLPRLSSVFAESEEWGRLICTAPWWRT